MKEGNVTAPFNLIEGKRIPEKLDHTNEFRQNITGKWKLYDPEWDLHAAELANSSVITIKKVLDSE